MAEQMRRFLLLRGEEKGEGNQWRIEHGISVSLQRASLMFALGVAALFPLELGCKLQRA